MPGETRGGLGANPGSEFRVQAHERGKQYTLFFGSLTRGSSEFGRLS
jgi:hypothetical protein